MMWTFRVIARCVLALLLCGGFGAARAADDCTVTLSNIAFTAVSPIAGSDYTATGSGSVSCTWAMSSNGLALLNPNAVVCINANLGSNSTGSNPRTMANGANLLQYNLYRDSTYAAASIWGQPSLAATPTPISITLTTPGLITGGTRTLPFTVYARIPAGSNLAAVKTVANADTVYSASFASAATLNYRFYGLGSPACTTGASASFSFAVQATVINNCSITATPMSFGNYGVLSAAVRNTSTLSVQCVNNNAYQIALNGGVNGTVAARKMKSTAGAETIVYELSAALDGVLWGDGTGGSTLYQGTGTGVAVPLTLYGRVPAQATPTPGDYKDTVTATVYF